MDDARYEAMVRRIAALEARLVVLESAAIAPGVQAKDLLKRYPKGMTKTDAANELGVTRATVYYMIADGRVKENGMGRVITQSVADLMYGNGIKHDKRRRVSSRTLRMGADNQ